MREGSVGSVFSGNLGELSEGEVSEPDFFLGGNYFYKNNIKLNTEVVTHSANILQTNKTRKAYNLIFKIYSCNSENVKILLGYVL